MFGDPGQHPRPDFILVVKREDVVRESFARQYLMRTGSFAFDAPPDTKQRGKDCSRLRRAPLAHAEMANNPLSSGMFSP